MSNAKVIADVLRELYPGKSLGVAQRMFADEYNGGSFNFRRLFPDLHVKPYSAAELAYWESLAEPPPPPPPARISDTVGYTFTHNTTNLFAAQTYDFMVFREVRLDQVLWDVNTGGFYPLKIDGVQYAEGYTASQGVVTMDLDPAPTLVPGKKYTISLDPVGSVGMLRYRADKGSEIDDWFAVGTRQESPNDDAPAFRLVGSWPEDTPEPAFERRGSLALSTNYSGSLYTAYTFNVTFSAPVTVYGVVFKGQTVDTDYTLKIGGVQRGDWCYGSALNAGKHFVDTNGGVALAAGTHTFQIHNPTNSSRWHFKASTTSHTDGIVTIGAWQEAPTNLPVVDIIFTTS